MALGITTSTPASRSWATSSGRAKRPAGNGGYRSSFLPAMSTQARKVKGEQLRAMRIHRRVNLTLDDLARWLNPIVRGWMTYYCRSTGRRWHPSYNASTPT